MMMTEQLGPTHVHNTFFVLSLIISKQYSCAFTGKFSIFHPGQFIKGKDYFQVILHIAKKLVILISTD